jgi:hypothetical protein
MKQLILPVFAIVLLASCKETAPPIDFGPKAKDTSYMAATEAPQQRVVVMEEFTGVTCTNCPAGHNIIKTLETANPDRIAAIGIQIYNFSQGNPVDEPIVKTQHDNRTQAGTQISNDVFGTVSAMPTAGIDRTVVNGTMLIDTRGWAGTVNTRLAQPTSANVAITSTYNAGSRQALITVHVAYTSAVSKAQNLTVALVENDITDAQEGVGPTGFEQNYVHQHVLRDVLTAPTGSTILNDKSIKQPGQVYERTFVYNVNADWKPENCEIVAFVSNNQGADKEIVQGATVHLK